MKLHIKHILPAIVAGLVMMLGACSEYVPPTELGQVQVSESYLSIPMTGGQTQLKIVAHGNWSIEKVMPKLSGNKVDSVKWLTVTPTSGTATSYTGGVADSAVVTLSAGSTLDGRSAQLLLHCNGETQRLVVQQGLPVVTQATCAQVIAGPDSKTYRVSGVCTAIANTKYGNWYLTDKTGTIMIYGTLDKDGKEQNFLSLNIEVGDEVTVEGPKTTYGSTVELVNVNVLKIKKSLIKVDSVKTTPLPVEGGEATAYLTVKGNGASVEVPAEAQSWLSIAGVQNDAHSSVVTFKAAPNTKGQRSTKIVFHTRDNDGKDYSAQMTLTQLGAISEVSVKGFLAEAVGEAKYKLAGVVSEVKDGAKGTFTLKDFSGQVLVYHAADFASQQVQLNDIVTLVGTRAEYKGVPQLASSAVQSVSHVTPLAIADVASKEDSKTVYYLVTGVISNIANAVYGNMTLKSGEHEVYLYGCVPGYGASGDARKNFVTTAGLKVGDTITVIATKGTHNGKAQLVNGMYVSHQAAQ